MLVLRQEGEYKVRNVLTLELIIELSFSAFIPLFGICIHLICIRIPGLSLSDDQDRED